MTQNHLKANRSPEFSVVEHGVAAKFVQGEE